MKDIDQIQNIRDCFSAGFLFPHYCQLKKTKKPLILSNDPYLLWEIKNQFHFLKIDIEPRYYLINSEKEMNLRITGINSNSHFKTFDGKTNNYDLILVLTNDLTYTYDKPICYLGQIRNEMINYTYVSQPIYHYLSLHPGVRIILSNTPELEKLSNKT